ncbi:MAG: ATP-binding protein [Desulfovibrio sp.]|nr:MAG: ATP-binding protein [Desulfovibrio sp.]
MTSPRPLGSQCLRAVLDPSDIGFKTSHQAPPDSGSLPPQPRALQALELSLHIRDKGYNVYLAGGHNMGRKHLLLNFLLPHAEKAETPPDLIYVNNFQDADKPLLMEIPPGKGRLLKKDLHGAIAKMRKELPAMFESDANVKKRRGLMDTFEASREQLMAKMEGEAAEQGFNLDLDAQGSMTLYPLVEGKIISEDEYERLDPALRKDLKVKGDDLLESISGVMRQINKAEEGLREDEQNLDRQIVRQSQRNHLDNLIRRFSRSCKCDQLKAFFKNLKKDMLDNIDHFIPKDPVLTQVAPGEGLQIPEENHFLRYEINVFVDNTDAKGAPLIVEDNPTTANLLGCIERESELGALVTDFTLIKAGSLHKANGGFLIMRVEDIMQHSSAWEGLLRAMRSGRARIEESMEGQDQARTKTIEPQAVPMNVKVLLIGTDETYELLLDHEDRFPKLFKIKAHLQDSVDRNEVSIAAYAGELARMIREAGLLPFDRTAMAALVDHGSRMAGDQEKLSLRMPRLRELVVEASAMATMERRKHVDAEFLRGAVQARNYRANLYEDEFMEEYDRELIKVATRGESVGRVNGLSVTWFGDYEFGLPHQIACTVGVGRSGIVDLEREAELGGPIHTKAMMILKSFLLGMFAQEKPLVLSGSLCFEQSYAQVEGDSASGAELAALLSALSGAPIRHCLAFTGAVNQSGHIMAVGGVTRKVEGFFEVCRRRGLTGEQGVLIPADNVRHLMLKQEVVDAVDAGQFAVYPVTTIQEALILLTNQDPGDRRKDGSFTQGSLFQAVDQRLVQLAAAAKQHDPGNGG